MKQQIFLPLILVSLLGWSNAAFSSDDANLEGDEQQAIDSIEGVLETQIPKTERKTERAVVPAKVAPKVDYTDVKTSAAFSEIVTVQKNMMPKTSRMQIFGAVSLVANDVFYRTYGLALRASYHFSESWGAEISSYTLTSQEAGEINDLRSQSIGVENLVSVKGYLGANVYFNSSYGKAAFGEKIIPFEIYETAGYGNVKTSGGSSSAMMFGVGQIFSRTRSSGVRIDLSLLLFNSKNSLGENQASNLIVLSVGYGGLMPSIGARE